MRNVRVLFLLPLLMLSCKNLSEKISVVDDTAAADTAVADADTALLADADTVPPDAIYDGWPVADEDGAVIDDDAAVDDEDGLWPDGFLWVDADVDNDVAVDVDQRPDIDPVVWVRVWGTERVDEGSAIEVDAAGDIYVAGIAGTHMDGQIGPGAMCTYKTYTFPCSDLFLTKWRDDGTKVWTRLWGSDTMDTLAYFAVDPAGGSYALGSGMVTKFDSAGDESWRVTGDDAAGMRMLAAPATDGLYLVRRGTEEDPEEPGTTRAVFTLVHWSAAGALAWERDVTPADKMAYFHIMGAAPTGDIVLAGGVAEDRFNEDGYPLLDVYLARFSAAGDLLWDRRWNGGHDDTSIALTFDAEGNLYLLGTTNVLTQRGLDQYQFPYPFLKKFAPDGTVLWEARMDLFVGFDFDGGVVVGADGRIYTVGARGRTLFVATFEPDGTPVAVRSIDTQYFDGTVADVAVDPEGYLYVAGVTYEHTAMGLEDIYLMKIDPALAAIPVEEPDDDGPTDDDATVPDEDGIPVPPGEMVEVPAGPFMMGCNTAVDDACDEDEYPYHQVTLSAYTIGKYEVTIEEYRQCIAAGPCGNNGTYTNYRSDGSYSGCNINVPGKEKHPMNCVTWHGAAAYCAWIGGRLPTEAEWEKAARGTDGRKYTWGNAPEPSCELAVIGEVYSGCGEGAPMPVGSKPAGVSPYGAYDMLGNVTEWLSDWYDAGYYAVSPANDPQGLETPIVGAEERVMRGEAFYIGAYFLRVSNRDRISPFFESDSIGFRCAE